MFLRPPACTRSHVLETTLLRPSACTRSFVHVSRPTCHGCIFYSLTPPAPLAPLAPLDPLAPHSLLAPFVTPPLTRFARSFEAGATSSVSELAGDRGTAVGTAGGTVTLVGGKATSSNANLTENQGRGVTAGETAIVGGSAHGESVSDVGGRVEVRAGAADAGRGGDVVVLAGAGNTSSSGTVRLESADAGTNGTSGDVTVSTGAGASAGQGKVDASNTTNNAHLDAGSVLLASGAALQGRSGDVVLVRFIELLPRMFPALSLSLSLQHTARPSA